MKMRDGIKSYSELITLPTFEERFEYLRLNGTVGSETFGHDRYLNQTLYRSPEWKRFRHKIKYIVYSCDEISGNQIKCIFKQIFARIYKYSIFTTTLCC